MRVSPSVIDSGLNLGSFGLTLSVFGWLYRQFSRRHEPLSDFDFKKVLAGLLRNFERVLEAPDSVRIGLECHSIS